MSKLMMDFCGNVNTATMKIKKLDGVDHLVGPVIMARELVMNKLLYPAAELKAAIPHWNGVPIVVNHPKDAGGSLISANEPTILEASGIGFVFGANYDTKTTRQKAELWINIAKLEKHADVKAIIAAGNMLEVSTGLFLTRKDAIGDFGGREYDGIATNHKPDHLAVLPDKIGACSVADGAGFPRVNESMEINELSGGEKYSVLAKAVRKTFYKDGIWVYLGDVYDTYVIFEKSVAMGYEYYKVSYTIGSDEQTVTFTSEPTKVVRKVDYVDAIATNVLQQKSTTGTETQTHNEEKPMKTQKEKIQEMLAGNRIDAAQAATLETYTPEQFAVYEKVPFVAAQTLSTDEKKGDEDSDTEDDTVEGNAKKTDLPLTPAITVNDADAWMKKQYASKRVEFIDIIMGNKSNTFKRADLESETMSINMLEGMAALSGKTADMSLAPSGGAGKVLEGNEKKVVVEAYVPEHMRITKK